MDRGRTLLYVSAMCAGAVILSLLFQQPQQTPKPLQHKPIVEEVTYDIKDDFIWAANLYEVDWVLIYSIARLETGNFTSRVYLEEHNVGGMMRDGEYLSYGSDLEGILELTRLIKYYYIDIGLTDPWAIGQKYCPANPDWGDIVDEIMKEVQNEQTTSN